MSKTTKVTFLVATLLIVAALLFINQKQREASSTVDNNQTADALAAAAPSQPETPQSLQPPESSAEKTQPPMQAVESSEKSDPTLIILTANNFEELVLRCFRGEPCKLGADPWALYQEFKNSGRIKATDSLIAFMRKLLQNPEYREKYKTIVKDMIRDFYPPEKRDFQEAAYHAYLGELEKSLEIYLSIDKKAESNPTIYVPPRLNIANVYYDLQRYKEALPYYKQSLSDMLSGRQKLRDQQDTIQFVQDRIDEIERQRL